MTILLKGAGGGTPASEGGGGGGGGGGLANLTLSASGETLLAPNVAGQVITATLSATRTTDTVLTFSANLTGITYETSPLTIPAGQLVGTLDILAADPGEAVVTATPDTVEVTVLNSLTFQAILA